jgi:hypothetical protein
MRGKGWRRDKCLPFENLFRIRPTGVTLKKRMVPFITVSSSLLCRLLWYQLVFTWEGSSQLMRDWMQLTLPRDIDPKIR